MAVLLALMAFTTIVLGALLVSRTVDEARLDGAAGTVPTRQEPQVEPGPGVTNGVVAIYGDSLIWEARAALSSQLGRDVPVRIESFGGTALCDYADQIIANASSEPTRLVVIGFTGNTFTPCMERLGPGLTPEDVTTAYAEDLERVLGALRRSGTPVLLLGAPPARALDGSTVWKPTDKAWQDAAARWADVGADVTYADTGLVLTDPDGRWAGTLPCLPFEDDEMGCTSGSIRVRSDDSFHFCSELGLAPDGVIQECAMWSSGAWRYAGSITEAVRDRLSLREGADTN